MSSVIDHPVPTNVITGFLGVGKTTAIQHLLKHKPDSERWAVLVNEFGEIGVDGSMFSGASGTDQGVFIKEVPGGCMCCVSGLPMQVALNLLLSEAKPDRLLIEPTGLGHPKEVLATFDTDYYRSIIDLRATLTLVDARKVTDERYRNHDIFRQQISVADRIIASKSDLYEGNELENLQAFLDKMGKSSVPVEPVVQGQLDWHWLNESSGFFNEHSSNTEVQNGGSEKPSMQFHGFFDLPKPAPGFETKGARFEPELVFDFNRLFPLLSGVEVERLKAIFITQNGIFVFNKADGVLSVSSLDEAMDSRIEVITDAPLDFDKIEVELRHAVIDSSNQ
ncbi:CobW family GTP-binding protein [Paraneptunicella aestuarii]|uniref:CobW family GTP-binding protein n=1 Tax=Paraneptunicella aestuarii TaxID=2831148 RepID=UPI001E2D7CFB|nr:GTP-binding protein [Paraneptunicella aestuarii]